MRKHFYYLLEVFGSTEVGFQIDNAAFRMGLSEIAKGLSDGTIDRRVLAEVAAFAHYRLGQNRKEPASKKSEKVTVETAENSLEE